MAGSMAAASSMKVSSVFKFILCWLMAKLKKISLKELGKVKCHGCEPKETQQDEEYLDYVAKNVATQRDEST